MKGKFLQGPECIVKISHEWDYPQPQPKAGVFLLNTCPLRRRPLDPTLKFSERPALPPGAGLSFPLLTSTYHLK